VSCNRTPTIVFIRYHGIIVDGPVGGLDDWQGKPKHLEKACRSAALSTTDPTLIHPGSNSGRRGGKPVNIGLNYGTTSNLTSDRTNGRLRNNTGHNVNVFRRMFPYMNRRLRMEIEPTRHQTQRTVRGNSVSSHADCMVGRYIPEDSQLPLWEPQTLYQSPSRMKTHIRCTQSST
jgi:hypothetical protein